MVPRLLAHDAVLVECADAPEARALHRAARLRRGDGRLVVGDLVPAARTVLFDGVADPRALAAEVGSWPLDADPAAAGGDRLEVPTTYDGADLADVAALWSMTSAEVVRTVQGLDFVVAFCGFAPGFGYCAGLPPELAVPRLASPRARVPTGAVGLAGEYAGVYPSASPGGWRLLGRTDLRVWDAERDPPALLVPGTRVRFVDA